MACKSTEQMNLQLPKSLIGKSAGISLDMGGSVLKIVYLDQAGLEGPDSEQNDSVTVRFKSFARTNLEAAVSFLNTLHVRRESPDAIPTVYTTGVGLQNLATRIEKEMNIKVENAIETDCFIRAALYLVKNLPEKVVSTKLPEKAIEVGSSRARNAFKRYAVSASRPRPASNPDSAQIKMIRPLISAGSVASVKSAVEGAAEHVLSDEPIAKQEGAFPFLLGLLGSALPLLKVWEDGSYRILTMNQIGGRTFLSLGSILTGVQSYEELIELAEKGNHRELNVYLKDLIKADGKSDAYSNASDLDLFVYAFGKGLGKNLSDFRKEDLASALLHLVAHNHILQTVTTMLTDGCGHYMAAGSFPTSDVTTDIIVEEFLNLLAQRGVWYDKSPKARLHIPKLGQYFGALGAFLYGCDGEI